MVSGPKDLQATTEDFDNYHDMGLHFCRNSCSTTRGLFSLHVKKKKSSK